MGEEQNNVLLNASKLAGRQALTFWIAARPCADFRIALMPFLQTKTKCTVLTMWSVWAREFEFRTLCF